MSKKNIIVFAVCMFFSLQSFSLIADQKKIRGKVLKVNGEVEVIDAKGDKRSVKNIDEPLHEMDTIVTKKGGHIVVQFDDGALSVLDEKSRLRVEQTSWFSYLGGKIYFTFKKIFAPTRYVKTRAATIGVRGTTFIISENSEQDGEYVALKKGLLRVESTGPAFEIHKTKILDEFGQFKLQQQRAKQVMQDEFDEYKQRNMREFIEYRREFILRADRVINLSGYRVDESAMTEADRADFESFESEAEDLIKAFRDRSKN